jgi:hypothetical protein
MSKAFVPRRTASIPPDHGLGAVEQQVDRQAPLGRLHGRSPSPRAGRQQELRDDDAIRRCVRARRRNSAFPTGYSCSAGGVFFALLRETSQAIAVKTAAAATAMKIW